MKRLVVAKNIGFCFGVRRSVKMAERLLEKNKSLYSIGDIVHNPIVMKRLKTKGLKVVKGLTDIKEVPFIVRSHGIEPDIIAQLEKKGVVIHDATCPSVKKIHSLIKKLDREEYFIIIIGNKNHPEVEALKRYGGNTCVSRGLEGFKVKRPFEKAAVIGQTTLSFRDYFQTARYFVNNPGFAREIVVYNTICGVTGERQEESARISRETEVVLVLGGKTSSNTTKLYLNCRRFNDKVFHIEDMDELEKISLTGMDSVGLLSGTSTPDDFICAVKEYMIKKGYEEVRSNGKD